MRTLARIARQGRTAGQALPSTLRALDRLEAKFRKGEVSVISGPPGAGKTALALHIAMQMAVPTLYISADSGDVTQMVRAISMLTGMDQRDAEEKATLDPEWAATVLAGLDIRWGGDTLGFDASPTIHTIKTEIRAYTEVYGEPPALIIIDSLYNIDTSDDSNGSGSMWAGLMDTVRLLKAFASQADAAVLVLHHTSEQKTYDSGENPSLASLQGKVGPLPSLVLTLKNDPQQGLLHIASVKNRHGIADRDGLTTEAVFFDPSRMAIQDLG